MTIARLIYLSYIATESEATSKTETVNFYSIQNKVYFVLYLFKAGSVQLKFCEDSFLLVNLCQRRNSTSNKGKWIQQERWKFALFVLLNLLVFENSQNCFLIMFHQNHCHAVESQPIQWLFQFNIFMLQYGAAMMLLQIQNHELQSLPLYIVNRNAMQCKTKLNEIDCNRYLIFFIYFPSPFSTQSFIP